jgi:hypothetical protein
MISDGLERNKLYGTYLIPREGYKCPQSSLFGQCLPLFLEKVIAVLVPATKQ